MTKAERMSGMIGEVQSICLECDFLHGNFKEREAVEIWLCDVIIYVLSVLDF